MPAEPREPVVPAAADVDDPLHRVAERLGRDDVARLPSLAPRLEQARVRERRELLRDRLPRHAPPDRELGRRRAPALGHRLDQVAAAGIAERVEDGPYAAAHSNAKARSSSAVLNSGEVSRTWRRVPSGTGSRSNSTAPSSSQSSTSFSPGTASRTVARRSSPFSQRKIPSPPSCGSSSTSLANHSSSRSGSVRASQSSSGSTGKTISRSTCTAGLLSTR